MAGPTPIDAIWLAQLTEHFVGGVRDIGEPEMPAAGRNQKHAKYLPKIAQINFQNHTSCEFSALVLARHNLHSEAVMDKMCHDPGAVRDGSFVFIQASHCVILMHK